MTLKKWDEIRFFPRAELSQPLPSPMSPPCTLHPWGAGPGLAAALGLQGPEEGDSAHGEGKGLILISTHRIQTPWGALT